LLQKDKAAQNWAKKKIAALPDAVESSQEVRKTKPAPKKKRTQSWVQRARSERAKWSGVGLSGVVRGLDRPAGPANPEHYYYTGLSAGLPGNEDIDPGPQRVR
jgi:hypothetical protein